jgi:hypothetical protein
LATAAAHRVELPKPSLPEAEEMGRLCRMIEFFYEINARIARARQPVEPEPVAAPLDSLP